jgi:hypothetical protein
MSESKKVGNTAANFFVRSVHKVRVVVQINKLENSALKAIVVVISGEPKA